MILESRKNNMHITFTILSASIQIAFRCRAGGLRESEGENKYTKKSVSINLFQFYAV